MSNTREKRATRGQRPERLGDMVDFTSVETENSSDESDYLPSMVEVEPSGKSESPESESPESEGPETPPPTRKASPRSPTSSQLAQVSPPDMKRKTPPAAISSAPAPKRAALPRSPSSECAWSNLRDESDGETSSEAESREASYCGKPVPKTARPQPAQSFHPDLKRKAPASASISPPTPKRSACAPQYIDLTGEQGEDDPIGHKMSEERLQETAVAENYADQLLTGALSVVRASIVCAEKSVLNGPNKTGVRAMLRKLVDADKSMTSVETRRLARLLVELDRKMVAAMRDLEASLSANPRVKNRAYERFLRENPCPVCMEPFVDRRMKMAETVRFQCDHAVHTSCMIDWCRAIPTGRAIACPLCRAAEVPLDPHPQSWHTTGHILEDEATSSESDEDPGSASDRAFRGRLPSNPAMLAADRVTRSAALQNVAEGLNPYTPR